MKHVLLALLLVALPCLAQDDTLLDLPVTRPVFETRLPSPTGVNGIIQAPLTPVGPTTSTPRPPVAPLPSPPIPPEPVEDPRDWPFPVLWGEEIAADKLILVLDTSQSMFDTPGRMPAALAEISRMIVSLPPHTKFDVVRFTSDLAIVLWPRNPGAADEGMQEATDANKAAAITFLSAPKAGGNTPTYEGVRKALEFLKNKHVVLVTDGAPFALTPWAAFELDPRVYGRGWVPGVPGPAPEYLSGKTLPDGTGLTANVLEHEYLIRHFNHVIRPQNGAAPARIDVFGIDTEGGDWERRNADWFCSTVAQRNGGFYNQVPIP